MKNLKKDDGVNLGQDGHIGGGGYTSSPSTKKSKFKYVLIGLGIAVLAIILLSIL